MYDKVLRAFLPRRGFTQTRFYDSCPKAQEMQLPYSTREFVKQIDLSMCPTCSLIIIFHENSNQAFYQCS